MVNGLQSWCQVKDCQVNYATILITAIGPKVRKKYYRIKIAVSCIALWIEFFYYCLIFIDIQTNNKVLSLYSRML